MLLYVWIVAVGFLLPSVVLEFVYGVSLQDAYFFMGFVTSPLVRTVLIIFIFVPSFFLVVWWAVHHKAKAPGSKWWHVPVCCVCMLLEVVNAVVIQRFPAVIRSKAFQFASPYVFSGTAFLTRRAVEESVLPVVGAARLSSCSLALGVALTRISQSGEMNSVEAVMQLEVYLFFTQVLFRVFQYYRQAAISLAMHGECQLFKVPRNPRAQEITTISILNEGVFDSTGFIVSFVLHYAALSPSTSWGALLGELLFGLTMQVLANAVTFRLIHHYEKIPIADFYRPWWRSWTVFRDYCIYFLPSVLWGFSYLALLMLSVWDSNMSTKELPSIGKIY